MKNCIGESFLALFDIKWKKKQQEEKEYRDWYRNLDNP